MTQGPHATGETTDTATHTNPATPAPACGETDVTTCPGTTVTLNRHPHHDVPDDTQRHSHGALAYRSRTNSASLDVIDADIANWCPTCQRQLLTCRRAGCRHARETAVAFAYAGAEYATILARRGHRRWDENQEVIASKTAWDKAEKRLEGDAGDPSRWDPDFQPTSLVNWFGAYVPKAIHSAFGADSAQRDGQALDSLDELATPSDDEAGPRHHRHPRRTTDGLAGENTEDTALEHLETEEFQRQWQDLVNRMIDAVAVIPIRGRHPHPPRRILLEYLARFSVWIHHPDNSYGPEDRNDREVARALEQITSNKTVDRIRLLDLIPALTALGNGDLNSAQHAALTALHDNPDLTEDQHAALTTLDSDGPEGLTENQYATLSALHDTPGLTENQYATLTALTTLHHRTPLTDSQHTALKAFIGYLNGHTPHLPPPPRAPRTITDPTNETTKGGTR